MKSQEALTEPSAPTREEEQAEVIRRLEEDIIFGRFAPGSRLVEDTLMTRYRASRHFVRQALFQLERQGIVLREKNIGATVRFYSAEEVRQIYEEYKHARMHEDAILKKGYLDTRWELHSHPMAQLLPEGREAEAIAGLAELYKKFAPEAIFSFRFADVENHIRTFDPLYSRVHYLADA